ncbi:MAG: YebC/PmpR family DNA-binding transcriptional regulator [Planctomycetes bacterium]|nr:YebC/PmpR family DNA-binding transcriptional regulator [Planctomycetota bacterium]
MAGHSHWAGIKYKKAINDSKRGKLFSKLSRAIMVAARHGADPDFNPQLRSALDQARSSGLPKDNIERAVAKGGGDTEGANLVEIRYEAFGPGGAAVLIECITDNVNRTLPEVRKLVEQYNGKMGSAGTVAWMFKRKGLISVEKEGADEDALMTAALDAGAEDIQGDDGDVYEITTAAEDFGAVKEAVAGGGFGVKVAELTLIAENELQLDTETQVKALKLMSAVEDHDDVQNVYANFTPSAEAVKKLEG